MHENLRITEAAEADLDDVLEVERAAFGEEEEAALVRELLRDPSALPRLSLIAHLGNRAVGHVLFTAATVSGSPQAVSAQILAPLAVVPDAQGRGIGTALAQEGLRLLAERGTDLVFVLGHPGYYPRLGFEPAGRLGLDAPYPIPDKDADAWMVQALRDGLLGTITGTVQCADALDRPEYWRE